jgi:hypothetical protein
MFQTNQGLNTIGSFTFIRVSHARLVKLHQYLNVQSCSAIYKDSETKLHLKSVLHQHTTDYSNEFIRVN